MIVIDDFIKDQKLLDDLKNDKTFFDRAAQGRYSPASTIKPAIALFGIENKIIDWDFTIDDPGYFILPEDGRIYRGWKKGGHGNINLNNAKYFRAFFMYHHLCKFLSGKLYLYILYVS